MSISQIFENMRTGWVETRELPALQQPEPLPATEQLKRNLERAEETYRLREHVLLAEIADRQAELVDVRRAADAVMAGLLGLEVRVDGDPTCAASGAGCSFVFMKRFNAFGCKYCGRDATPEEDKELRSYDIGAANLDASHLEVRVDG